MSILVWTLIKAVVIIFDIIALGWSYGILHWADSAEGRWVWIAVLFLLIGLFVGVIRGLRHLSEAEFTIRLGNIRKLGRFLTSAPKGSGYLSPMARITSTTTTITTMTSSPPPMTMPTPSVRRRR